ncbi:MAG: 2-C-methyl-D-erythritol 4-phosphate cytidylyltransferase [Candidatus Manganitrophaceae bacterium]|nr:MAG: 2-C-methyl-D-erythritol 4-phosphate cytidylyltransferase [Candidatus Manganitrophaceae bacterium]
MRIHAVIPAAGQGKRLGGNVKKQFLSLCGLPIAVHTLAVFQRSPLIDEIICIAPKEDLPFFERLVSDHSLTKVAKLLPGGERRQDSVLAGLFYLEGRSDPDGLVAVHDAVRPLVTTELIERVVEGAKGEAGAVAALPVADSLKEVSSDRMILKSLSRESVWAMQTPQVFRLGTLIEAYRRAAAEGWEGTDEAMLVERLGLPIRCVEGSIENIKITTPPDLHFAETLLRARGGGIHR